MTMISIISRLCALLLLLILAPALLLISLICIITQGRPIVFQQFRAGKGSRSFQLLKFRSMRNTRDKNGELLPDEQRVTKLGTFLRRSRLDELPGLVNIVRGEMAFVGPRPLMPITIEELGERGQKRCTIKPGLTGWSQVNGNTLLMLDQKVTLDLWYIDNRSALLDLKILLLTLLVVVSGEKVRTDTAS